MAKLSFTKLALKSNGEVANIQFGDQVMEIKKYLPFKDKLDMITSILNKSIDNNNFYNPVRVKFYMELEIIERYTNLTFTEKQKEDLFKLYDLLKGNGIIDMVIDIIPEVEIKELKESVYGSIESVYSYKNSVMGILEAVSNDYKDLNLKIDATQEKISNPENLAFLKDVLTKMG